MSKLALQCWKVAESLLLIVKARASKWTPRGFEFNCGLVPLGARRKSSLRSVLEEQMHRRFTV